MGTLLVFHPFFLPFCQTWQRLVEIFINEQNLAFLLGCAIKDL